MFVRLSKKAAMPAKNAQDQGDPHEPLSPAHQVAPDGGVGQYYVVQEPGLPDLYVRMIAACLGQGAVHETGDG